MKGASTGCSRLGRLGVWLMLWVLCGGLAAWAREGSVRALHQIHSTSRALSTVLPTNAGWQPIYTLTIVAQEGDLLRLVGQSQLTVEGTPMVGQQLRLTVAGQPVGTQVVEINTQPGSHHLPMATFGLYLVTESGEVQVTLEGSSFHSQGDFLVQIDQHANLAYGSLLVEQYRVYSSGSSARENGALFLSSVAQSSGGRRPLWGQEPYRQEVLASLTLPVKEGDLLRPSARAVGSVARGLEQFTGVLTSEGVAVSPYGGQNVLQSSPWAPMLIEGVTRAVRDGPLNLEHRIYGAFGNGMRVLDEATRFEVSHFAREGRGLVRFGQEQLPPCSLVTSPQEVWSQEIDLQPGDLLSLTSSLLLGLSTPGGETECRLELRLEGPSGSHRSATRQRLSPTRSVAGLTTRLTLSEAVAGPHRMSLWLTTESPQGPRAVRIDSDQSQLQYLLYGALPDGQPEPLEF